MKTKSAATKTARKHISAFDAHNTRVRAEHAKLVDSIMTHRPTWDREALAAVARTWGSNDDPGLFDILQSVHQADALAARFTKRTG